MRLRSGLNVRVVECGPPDGPPVVLLPGWAVSAFAFRHQLPTLGAAGYRATAVDLKGHGFSDKPTGPREYSFEAMVAHVEEVIEAIAHGAAAIVAQSMAGPLGIEVASTRPTLVSALVLIGPVGLGIVPFNRLAALLTPRPLDPIAPYFIPRWVVRAGLGLAYGNHARISEDTVDEYWAPAQFPDFARALRALVHQFRWSPLPDARLAALDHRTLVVFGSRDRLVRRWEKRVNRLVGATVAVIEDAGHAVNEERPEAFNAVLLEFLHRCGV